MIPSRRYFIVGVAAALLTVAVGATAYAQSTPAPAPGKPAQQRQELVDAVAAKLGKTPAEVRAAIVAVQKEQVAKALQEGRITREQADRANQRIDQAGGRFLGPGLADPRGPKAGSKTAKPGAPAKPGTPGKPGEPAGPQAGLRGAPAAVAGFLGIDVRQLQTELRSGKSLAQVAQEKGKSREQLKAFLTDQAKARLDAAVRAGRITQARADEMLKRMAEGVDRAIDARRPAGQGRARGVSL